MDDLDDFDDEDDGRDWAYTNDESKVALPFEDVLAKGQVLVERLLGSFAWFASLAAVLAAGFNQVTGGGVEAWWPNFPYFQGAAVVLGADAAGVVTLSRAWRAAEHRRYGAACGWGLVALGMFWLGGLNVLLQGMADFAHLGGPQVLAMAGLTTVQYALIRSLMLMAVLAVMTVARHKPVWRVERERLQRVNQSTMHRPRSVRRGGGGRTLHPVARGPVGFRGSLEAKARRAWQPGMSVSALQAATGMSRGSASKWARILKTEAA